MTGPALALCCWLALTPNLTAQVPPNPQGPVITPALAPTVETDPTTPTSDRWLAEDKLRHFALSFAVTEMTYATARVGLSADPALATAAGTALLAGLGKELHDLRPGGSGFSLRDLAWDLAGVALGTVLAHQIR